MIKKKIFLKSCYKKWLIFQNCLRMWDSGYIYVFHFMMEKHRLYSRIPRNILIFEFKTFITQSNSSPLCVRWKFQLNYLKNCVFWNKSLDLVLVNLESLFELLFSMKERLTLFWFVLLLFENIYLVYFLCFRKIWETYCLKIFIFPCKS